MPLLPEQLRAWRRRQAGTFHRGRATLQGWTQEQAADWIGVSRRQWCRWENGETPIPTYVVRRLTEHQRNTLNPFAEAVP